MVDIFCIANTSGQWFTIVFRRRGILTRHLLMPQAGEKVNHSDLFSAYQRAPPLQWSEWDSMQRFRGCSSQFASQWA